MTARGRLPKARQSKPAFAIPGATGATLVPAGTCPGCKLESHPGVTCDGRTTAEVIALLWPGVRLIPERDAR